MQVSVVVASWNKREMVVGALKSVLDQTYRDLEIIMVDDGSTDGTAAHILATFGAEPQAVAILSRRDQTALPPFSHLFVSEGIPVRYLYRPNRGLGAARNCGIRHAEGAHIAFLEAEDLWDATHLETQIAFLEGNSGARICHVGESPAKRSLRTYLPRIGGSASGWIFANCLEDRPATLSSAVVHRSCFAECGEFDEEMPDCEDYDLWLRLAALFPIYFVEGPVVTRRSARPDGAERAWASDRFRVYSLERAFQSGQLNPEQRFLVSQALVRKCEHLVERYRRMKSDERASLYERKRRRFAQEVRKLKASSWPAKWGVPPAEAGQAVVVAEGGSWTGYVPVGSEDRADRGQAPRHRDGEAAESSQRAENGRGDRIMFGASVPNVCRANVPFVTRFIAYPEQQHQMAVARLRAIAPSQRPGLDLGTSHIAPGTRIAVLVTSRAATASPPPQSLRWEGEMETLDFLLTLSGSGDQTVFYRVILEGAVLSAFSMDVEVSTSSTGFAGRRESTGLPLPQHVFASYSSQDRLRVLDAVQAIQTLTDIDVFLDCLRLRNGSDWEKQLRKQIEESELLWLFWSHFARDSEWVQKEWRIALSCHGINGIVPQALEPLDLAPPPQELASLHFSETIAQIREWVGRSHGKQH